MDLLALYYYLMSDWSVCWIFYVCFFAVLWGGYSKLLDSRNRIVKISVHSTFVTWNVLVYATSMPAMGKVRPFSPHQKRDVILSQPILEVISPLSAYSWINNSYYLIILVNDHWSFEILSHGIHSTIFDDIVFNDLTSITCIVIIICVYNCNIDKML